jgi:hypothetical protein
MSDKPHSLKSDHIAAVNEAVASEHGWDAVYGVQFGKINTPMSFDIGEPIQMRSMPMKVRIVELRLQVAYGYEDSEEQPPLDVCKTQLNALVEAMTAGSNMIHKVGEHFNGNKLRAADWDYVVQEHYDGSKCPACGSREIAGGPVEASGTKQAYRAVNCQACEHTWTENFEAMSIDEDCQSCGGNTREVFVLNNRKRVCRKCMEEQGP